MRVPLVMADPGAVALSTAGDLPVGDLEAGRCRLWVTDQNVSGGEATMKQAFAVGEGHRLAKLANKAKRSVEGEIRVPQAEVTVEADSLGIVLKYEGRPEL